MVDVVIQVLRRFDLLLVCRVSVQFSTVLIHLAAETGCQWCLSLPLEQPFQCMATLHI